jgi:hypothetical protein
MSEFNEEGFFSTSSFENARQCRKQFADWFNLCESINKMSLAITRNVPYRPSKLQKATVAALFLREISIYEGVIILIERCMTNEVKILLRSLIETLFILRAITLNEEMVQEYFQNQYKTKQKMAKILMKLDSTNPDLTSRLEKLTLIAPKEELTIKHFAEKAGLIEFYYTAYQVLSWTVHSNIVDIAQAHMVGNSENQIDSIYLSVDTKDTVKWFMTACESMLIAIDSVNNLFKAGIESQIETYREQYKKLYVDSKKES